MIRFCLSNLKPRKLIFMRKYWWKILGVILIIYSFTLGLLVPLKPGISSIDPGSMRTASSYQMEIVGYNTFYTKVQDAVRVWLKYDSIHALAASKTRVVNDRSLVADFDIPKYLPTNDRVGVVSVIVDDDYNGFSVVPSTVFITQDSVDKDIVAGSSAWKQGRIGNIHSKDQFNFPFRVQLSETIRNLYFHVPFWFSMFIIFIAGITQSIGYLSTNNLEYDYKSMSFTLVGTVFGIIGLCTGMIWAKDTWGTYWSWQEVKMNMTAIALLIYLSYFILRHSFDDDERRARISAVFSIFAFAAMIALLYVVPRMVSSLHPGSGGNPALGADDLDNSMRLVFYPAIIGWTLLGVWMASLVYRMQVLRDKLYDY